jgi:ATP adenylyltransferase
MDYLWTPWRYQYITRNSSPTNPPPECVFCAAAAGEADEESLIVHRETRCYVILNRFPYTNGHVMVVPYQHAPSLLDFTDETLTEMVLLARRCERKLRELYHPDGLNLGLNIGKSAGAGVAGHLHLHALPRWNGDSNFMTPIAETRILPEDLAITWERMRAAFETP